MVDRSNSLIDLITITPKGMEANRDEEDRCIN